MPCNPPHPKFPPPGKSCRQGQKNPFRPWHSIGAGMSAPKKAEIGADKGFDTRVGAEIGHNQHRDSPVGAGGCRYNNDSRSYPVPDVER